MRQANKITFDILAFVLWLSHHGLGFRIKKSCCVGLRQKEKWKIGKPNLSSANLPAFNFYRMLQESQGKGGRGRMKSKQQSLQINLQMFYAIEVAARSQKLHVFRQNGTARVSPETCGRCKKLASPCQTLPFNKQGDVKYTGLLHTVNFLVPTGNDESRNGECHFVQRCYTFQGIRRRTGCRDAIFSSSPLSDNKQLCP